MTNNERTIIYERVNYLGKLISALAQGYNENESVYTTIKRDKEIANTAIDVRTALH